MPGGWGAPRPFSPFSSFSSFSNSSCLGGNDFGGHVTGLGSVPPGKCISRRLLLRDFVEGEDSQVAYGRGGFDPAATVVDAFTIRDGAVIHAHTAQLGTRNRVGDEEDAIKITTTGAGTRDRPLADHQNNAAPRSGGAVGKVAGDQEKPVPRLAPACQVEVSIDNDGHWIWARTVHRPWQNRSVRGARHDDICVLCNRLHQPLKPGCRLKICRERARHNLHVRTRTGWRRWTRWKPAACIVIPGANRNPIDDGVPIRVRGYADGWNKGSHRRWRARAYGVLVNAPYVRARVRCCVERDVVARTCEKGKCGREGWKIYGERRHQILHHLLAAIRQNRKRGELEHLGLAVV